MFNANRWYPQWVLDLCWKRVVNYMPSKYREDTTRKQSGKSWILRVRILNMISWESEIRCKLNALIICGILGRVSPLNPTEWSVKTLYLLVSKHNYELVFSHFHLILPLLHSEVNTLPKISLATLDGWYCGFRKCSKVWNGACAKITWCTNLTFTPFDTSNMIVFSIKLGCGNIHRNIFNCTVFLGGTLIEIRGKFP